jgi:hypothetical protein
MTLRAEHRSCGAASELIRADPVGTDHPATGLVVHACYELANLCQLSDEQGESMKYIVTGLRSGPYPTDTRPTQEEIKSFGEGTYVLHRADGSVSKHFVVSVNRNGNLKVDAFDPEGLDAISTIRLERMVRAYGPIVKFWPKSDSAGDYRAVVDVVQARAALVGTVTMRRVIGERVEVDRAALAVVS